MVETKDIEEAVWNEHTLDLVNNSYSQEDRDFIVENIRFWLGGNVQSFIRTKLRYETGVIWYSGNGETYRFSVGNYFCGVNLEPLYVHERGVKKVYDILLSTHQKVLEAYGISKADFMCLAYYGCTLEHIDNVWTFSNGTVELEYQRELFRYYSLPLLHYLQTGRHYEKYNDENKMELSDISNRIYDQKEFYLEGQKFSRNEDVCFVENTSEEWRARLKKLFNDYKNIVQHYGHNFDKEIKL